MTTPSLYPLVRMGNLVVAPFFHKGSSTCSYVVSCADTRAAAIIDPALDFDVPSGRTATTFCKELVDYVSGQGLDCKYILETHVHADHLSGSQALKRMLPTPPPVAIGAGVVDTQRTFKEKYDLPDLRCDGSDFDMLLQGGQKLQLGNQEIRVLATPGHTADGVTYVCDASGAAFIGDTLFIEDLGSARCDFPNGSPKVLYDSIQTILSLGDNFTLFMGHDYPPKDGRGLRFTSTVLQQRTDNIHFRDKTSIDAYVNMRSERDAKLSVPNLLIPSVQVNIRAGHVPAFLKWPVNSF